jgi:hypothetical protein
MSLVISVDVGATLVVALFVVGATVVVARSNSLDTLPVKGGASC